MKKILVVEDDNTIHKIIEDILKKEHYIVISAYSGTEAISIIENDNIDLILLDLMLPGINGEDIVKKVNKTLPKIVISAKTSSVDKAKVLLEGANDYITKPFEKIELLARIQVQLRISSNKNKNLKYKEIELLEDNKITVDEIDYISKKLETKVNELEEITQIASSTISEITHYTTVTIGPNTDEQKIENIKFVLLSPRMMMAVILTDNGLVKETIIKFDEDISEKQVGTLSYMFNNKLKGEPISKIDRPLEKYLVDEMKYSVNLIKPIIEQMKKVVEEEKVHLEGAKQLFELPEFNSLEVAKNFVNILDEKELMADMLNTGITKDINVYIGEENEKDELKDFSIVTFKHRIGNKDLGTIGIIGPKRMDYAKVISVMKYISKSKNSFRRYFCRFVAEYHFSSFLFLKQNHKVF